MGAFPHPPTFLSPSPNCSTRTHAVHSLHDSTCTHFYRRSFSPWLAEPQRSRHCVMYKVPASGMGNWLPHILIAMETAIKTGATLKVVRLGSAVLFDTLGVATTNTKPQCESVTELSTRNGLSCRNRTMALRCLFTLLTCPEPAVVDSVAALQRQLPKDYAAIHARLGHNAFESEGGFLASLASTFAHPPEPRWWRESADARLGDERRVAPFDALVARAAPPLCASVCLEHFVTSRASDLPMPFMCCGDGSDVQRLVAAASRVGGQRIFLSSDATALLDFASVHMRDRFVLAEGTPMYSGAKANKLDCALAVDKAGAASGDAERAAERDGARKIAVDLLMLAGAKAIAPLNPSSFSRLAAALGPWAAGGNATAEEMAARVRAGTAECLPDRLGHAASLLHVGRPGVERYGCPRCAVQESSALTQAAGLFGGRWRDDGGEIEVRVSSANGSAVATAAGPRRPGTAPFKTEVGRASERTLSLWGLVGRLAEGNDDELRWTTQSGCLMQTWQRGREASNR